MNKVKVKTKYQSNIFPTYLGELTVKEYSKRRVKINLDILEIELTEDII